MEDYEIKTSLSKKIIISTIVFVIVLVLGFIVYLFTNDWKSTYIGQISGSPPQNLSIYTSKIAVFIYSLAVFSFIITIQIV